jgi:nicotinate-nucleotide pyrophosphorylase (carboxylating)
VCARTLPRWTTGSRGWSAARAVTEASGRISVETAPEIPATGVDLISSDWITHSAPILDLGFDIAG